MAEFLPTVHELPYLADSAKLFAPWADNFWSVFLDSGYPISKQGRFDILACDPYETLVTKGGMTEVRSAEGMFLSPQDPFTLLKERLASASKAIDGLPFSGGALGYFGYDLARRIEILPTMTVDAENIPEMLVGIYDWVVVVDHQQRRSRLVSQGRDPRTIRLWPQLIRRFSGTGGVQAKSSDFRIISDVKSNMSADEYGQAFRRIKKYIREGDCYQVNLAQRFSARCEGQPWFAYRLLRNLNAAPFSCYLNYPRVQILSSSPERFLKVASGQVETKPIKGTRPRSQDSEEDQAHIEALKNSAKDRAENLMIVDLLRNDLGKTCRVGSVSVPKLFEIESFATVHHLVSTVRGELADDQHALDLLRSCFPGGSITGAPKIRAMEIIEELEPNRRGIYCGSVGYIGFDGGMDTNIAIRTLVHSDNQIRFWAGGGIVADSDESEEYQESFDKAAALLKLLDRMKIGGGIDHVGG